MRVGSRRHGVVTIITIAALCACSESKGSLVVDLRTDLGPGREFASVRQVVIGPMLSDTSDVVASPSADFVTGRRVGEYRGLTQGRYAMTTQLLDTGRRIVAQRVTDVMVNGDVAVIVVVARNCRGAVCPGATDAPSATTCAGGRCVDPTCSSVDPSTCPAGCSADSACAPRAWCSMPRCVTGLCLYAPVAAACESGFVCDPDTGCVPDDTAGLDAGVDADAGTAADSGSAADAGTDSGAGAADAGVDAGAPPACTPGTEVGSCCNGGTRERDITCNPDGTSSTSSWTGCMNDGCAAGECCGGLRCRAC